MPIQTRPNRPTQGLGNALQSFDVPQANVVGAFQQGQQIQRQNAFDDQGLQQNALDLQRNEAAIRQNEARLQATTIEELAQTIPDPTERVQFLSEAANAPLETQQKAIQNFNSIGETLAGAGDNRQAVLEGLGPDAVRMFGSADSPFAQGMINANRPEQKFKTTTETDAQGNKFIVNRDPATLQEINRAPAGRASGGIKIGPDGTVSIGGFDGGQRDAETLSKELSKNDAALIEKTSSEALASQDVISQAQQMRLLLPNVGVTGLAGPALGLLDRATGLAPGNVAAREQFDQLSQKASLAFIGQTKGAVSDREMGIFLGLPPGLSRQNETNVGLIDAMEAGARRKEQQSFFFDEYLTSKGDLSGAQQAWSRYRDENPIFEADDELGIRVLPAAPHAEYLPGGIRSPSNLNASRESVSITPQRQVGTIQQSGNALGAPQNAAVRISSQEEFDRLPSGTKFITNSGIERRKP